jgi:hypothetical protein
MDFEDRTTFEAVGGSVPGRAHARAGRNNQDAHAWWLSGEAAVAVVCDGCSGAPRSEVGAQLGARLLVEALAAQLRAGDDLARPAVVLARAGGEVLAQLRALARALGGDPARAVAEHFLFTVVGAAIAASHACLFALGDGFAMVNGERLALGPYPGNEPPYLAYALLDDAPRASHALAVLRELPASAVQTILLGTDGVLDLEAAAAAGRRLPGRAELVAPPERLAQEERTFSNPDALRRRLTQLGRDAPRPASAGAGAAARLEHGLLPDDTTLVVLRRLPAADRVMS